MPARFRNKRRGTVVCWAARATHARPLPCRSRRIVAPSQHVADIAQAGKRVCAFRRALRETRSSAVIRWTRSQSSIRVRRISSLIVITRIVSSIIFRPRQSRPSVGGPCAGGGGCIACDGNGVDECFSTCSHEPTTARHGRKEKDGFGADGMEAQKCALHRRTKCRTRHNFYCARDQIMLP